LPVDAIRQVWQDGAAMNESRKQFSFSFAALSTRGRAKSNVLSIDVSVALSGMTFFVKLKALPGAPQKVITENR